MTTTLLPVPRPSRLRPWVRVLLWAVLLVGALLTAGGLSLWVSLSGGLDDVLDRPAPSPTSAEVVDSRERALADLRALTLPVDGAPLARGEGSGCEEGQHDGKVDDDHDLRCSAAISVVVPQESFREDALALHARLLVDGWQPGELALDRVVLEYADGQPGTSPAGLPGAGYTRDGVALRVDWLADGGGDVAAWQVDGLTWTPSPPVVTGLAVALTVTAEHFRA